MKKHYKKLLGFLTLLFSFSAITAQILTPTYPSTAQSITRGLNQTLLTVQVGFTSTCNSNIVTVQMPTSVRYVPGSLSKTSGTQTITESNISNLRAPQFSVSNVSGTGDITFTILREAGCGSLASGKDTVRVAGSCGTANEASGIVNTYNLFAPSISLTAPSSLTGFVVNRVATRTITITNGGNGDADTLFFYIVYPSAGIVNTSGSNAVVANSVSFTPFKTNGDTLFYKFFGTTLFGGNNLLTNGESVIVTEPIRVAKCNPVTKYAAGWGETNNIICSWATGTSNISMVGGVANFTSVSSTAPGFVDKCTPFDVNVSITNGGTGNDTAATMFNVKLDYGYNSDNITLSTFNNTQLSVSNGRINGNVISTFNTTGNIAQMDLNNLFATDPDGAGGLSDMDGDGFYDDLPRGATLTYTIRLQLICNLACGVDKVHYPGTRISYTTMCNVSTSATKYIGGAGYIYESQFSGIGYIPANISGGVPFRVLLKEGHYINDGNIYDNTNTRYRWFIKLPLGVSVSSGGSPTYGLSAATYTQSNDTVFIQSSTNSLQTAAINLVYNCAGGGGTVTFNYGLTKIANVSTGCICQGLLVCASFFTQALCPAPCPAGPTTYVPAVRRTDGSLGWTNSTMATRQVASAISAYDLSKALFLDTIQITGSAVQNSNVNNLHVELALPRVSNVNRLAPISIDVNIIRGGSTVATYTVNTFTNNSSGNTQIVDWDLSSGLPSGAMLIGDSVRTISKYIVADNATLIRNDVQSGGTWHYYSIISSVKEGCNSPVPEMYLVGTDAIDGRNGWSASGCNNVSDNAAHIARRFNTSGQLFATEYRPVWYIDSIVVTYPPTYDVLPASSSVTGALTPNLILGHKYSFYNPGTWGTVGLTVTNSYGTSISTPMKPTCRTSTTQTHNIKVYIRDFYYALHNSVSYPSTYKYVLGGGGSGNTLNNPSGRSIGISYSNTTAPLLTAQNLTGTVVGVNPQHYWDIQVQNNGVGPAPYSWVALEKYTGTGITIDSVKRLNTNAILSPTTYGAGNSWYQISTAGIASSGSETVRVFFKYANCTLDSVLFKTGWNCGSYPSPDPVTDTNACATAQVIVRVSPNESQVQLSVSRQPGAGSTIPLCVLDSVIVQLNSAQAANLISPRVEVFPPTGVTINSPVRVEYPLGSGNWQVVSTSAIVGGTNINLNTHTGISTNGIPGTINNPGAAGRQASVKIYYTTSCSHTSGSSFSFKVYGNKPCGTPAIGNGTNTKTDGINITGASVSGGMGVTLNIVNDTFRCGTPTRTLTLGSTPVITPTQAGDTIIYTLPAGLTYAGNFTKISNCGTCGVNTLPGILPNTTLVKVGLHPGVASGTAMSFSFDVNLDNGHGCGNSQISASARRQIAPLMCGITPCPNSSVVMAAVDKDIVLMKPDLTITSVNAAYPNAGAWYTYQYETFFTNNGNDDLKVNSGYKLEVYFDANNNGILDIGTDRLVHTNTLNSALAVGGSTSITGTFSDPFLPSATRAMWTVFNTATSPNCNCTPSSASAPVVGLPVNVIAYKIKPTACVNSIEWTATDVNSVQYYSIENLLNNNWKTVGRVEVNKNATTISNSYKFVHIAAEGKNYYRVVEMNKSGQSFPFQTLAVNNVCTANTNNILLQPNPAKNKVDFTVLGSKVCDNYAVILTNTEGKTILTKSYLNPFGQINTELLSPGIYLVNIKCEAFSETVKLIIE